MVFGLDNLISNINNILDGKKQLDVVKIGTKTTYRVVSR